MPIHLHTESPGSAASVPLRSEVRAEDTWDLTPLYGSDDQWEEDFRTLQAEYPGIEGFRGSLDSSATCLRDALEMEKAVDQRIEKLHHYASLRVTEDSSNSVALDREARLDSLLVRIGEAFSFLSPEIQAIPDGQFSAWLADPVLADWVIPLKKLRRLKPHTLSAGEERLLALGSAAVRGHAETFSQLTNVDMKFGAVRDGQGRERELTQSSFSSFLQQRDGAVRRAAFHKFYEEFQAHQFTIASSLASSVRADVFYARARNYPSALASALFRDDVPLSVYDNLISTVRKHLPPLYRYFGLRKKLLGLSEIHHYDTYVPIVGDVSTDVPWDGAVDRVLAALTPLGEEYTKTLDHGLRGGRWCDRYENKGKRSGAFSSGSYTSPPYIMMNYKADVFSDVYTLAHEAGHSMHTWYATRSQSYQNYNYPIFLAEVASTFNEILLTEHLLRTTDDRRMRAYIINRQIDDLRGTLYRQTMFAEFEKAIHAAEEAGEALTLDAFKRIYRGLLDAYFGPDFAIDEELEIEGLRIPHFYGAFYVYKYATGISAAVALADQVLATGDASRYLSFLRSGGSRFPIETLAEAGVDMSSPEPIAAALRLFERRVAELEELLA
ncbi:MAG TPA: oligoendopeptidase F [Terrimicrobiaceae bacterium]|nr:oligoendopeptidase F [Terrimicrobiaceae bacterium]